MPFRGLRVIEPVTVEDDFVNGVVKIEHLRGDNLRFTLAAIREIQTFGRTERVAIVRRHIVMAAQDALISSRAAYYAASGLQGVINEILIDDTRH